MPLEEREEEPVQQEAPIQEGQTVVTFNEDEDDDGDMSQGADPSTLDRRGRRSWIKETKVALETERSERQRLQREVDELRGRVSATPAYQPPAQQQVDPSEQHVSMLEQHMDAQIAAIQNAPQGTPQAQIDQWRTNYRQLERERYKILAQSAAPPPRQQPQGPTVEMQMLMAESPQIYSDQALNMEAQAEAIKLARSKSGGKVTFAIAREANQRVMQRNGLGAKQSAPNANVQAKLTGTPARAGASGGGGNSVTLTGSQRKMAIQYWNGTDFADKSDDEKIRRWTKEVWLKPDQP